MIRRYHADHSTRNPGNPPSTEAWAPYLGIAFPAIAITVVAVIAARAIAGGLPLPWVLYWSGLALIAATTPWLPAVAVGSVAALAYGTPRYGSMFSQLIELRLIDVSTGVVLAGYAARMLATRIAPSIHPVLFVSMLLLVVWVALCAIAAWSQGVPFQPDIKHHPANFFQALVLFFLASQTLGHRAGAIQFAAIFCASIVARAVIQGVDGLYLENDIALLAVMALPLTMLGMPPAQPLPWRAAFAFLALSLFAIVGLSLNRAAGTALAATLLLLWSQTGHRWQILAVSSPAIAGTLFWFAKSDYWDRFRAIWSSEGLRSSLDQATVSERLELWRGALQMVEDHPWFGVGPSNYEHMIGEYLSPALAGIPAHNSWLHLASETGLPGVILYTALFFSGLVVLQQAKCRRRGVSWPDYGARLVQASLVAYLVGALFITRHDMVLAYLLLGWASALWVSSRPTGRSDSPPGGNACRTVVLDRARGRRA